MCRFPPAKKVFFAEARMMPVRSFSASNLSTIDSKAGEKSSFMELTGPSISIVMVTIPSASFA